MLQAYSFQIGLSESKLLKMSGPDVGCCAIEEEDMVFKMHVTVKKCSISNDKTMGILWLSAVDVEDHSLKVCISLLCLVFHAGMYLVPN